MKVLVTGGLGLVGVSYAAHCLVRGDQVVVLDNEARGISNELNAQWLWRHPKAGDDSLRILHGDVSDAADVREALGTWDGVDAVVHLAAQSSVNRSMEDPVLDFHSNVLGTFVLFEALRTTASKARVVYFTSNKIYDTTRWDTEIRGTRSCWTSHEVGPSEDFPFYTDAREPYGASKIAGLYYARCYAALYQMPIIVAVPSGMYGPRQFGKSDQGWMGHFIISTLLHRPITICGDGYQVRDMVEVSDVCTAIDLLLELAPARKGELFNLGGGPLNAISLVEALEEIEKNLAIEPIVRTADWRPMDNKVYISNCKKLTRLGWFPRVGITEGIARVCDWAQQHRNELEQVYADRS